MEVIKNSTPQNKINENQGDVLDQQARDLVTEHFSVGKKLAWKLLSSWQARLPEDEVVSIVGVSLCEAARNYDGRASTKFQTFFYYHLRGNLLREITNSVNHRKLKTGECYENTPLPVEMINDESAFCNESIVGLEENTPENIMQEREDQEIFDDAFNSLDTLEKELVTRHYFNGESINNLAKSLDYCRCHLSRVKRNAIHKLRSSIRTSHDKEDCFVEDRYRGGRGRRRSGFDSKMKESLSGAPIKEMMYEAAIA